MMKETSLHHCCILVQTKCRSLSNSHPVRQIKNHGMYSVVFLHMNSITYHVNAFLLKDCTPFLGGHVGVPNTGTINC